VAYNSGSKGSFRKKYNPTLLLLWTVLIIAMFVYGVYDSRARMIEEAKTEARTYYELNFAYRKMLANIGGMYAPVDKVAPNPYLNVPNREIQSSDGRTLTLVNPAYMTRLAFETLQTVNKVQVRNRLVSLKYLNPGNAPNDWERKALLSFEHGEKEAVTVTTIKGEPFLMLMKPFLTEESCLKCHGHQGYKTGDIRGGISIAVPLHSYKIMQGNEEKRELMAYFMIWAVGIAGFLVFSRRRYDQEMKTVESEWKFRTVAETTNEWEFWLTPEGGITFMSPAGKALTGYSPEEFIADPSLLLQIIHPDDRDLWTSHLRHMDDPQHQDIALRIITRDGQVKWISHTCAPMHRDGVFIGRHSNNRDITGSRKVEETLKLTQQSIDSITDSIFWIDRTARLVYANEAACRNLGYSREELLSMTVFDVDPAFPRDKWEEHWQNILLRSSFAIETSHRTKDGRDISVEVTVNHVEFGGVHYNCAVARDITDRKRLEEQLRQAQKMESIGTLAGGVAHDFNNILTAITGYGHLTMMKMAPDDPNRLNLEQILEAADRAAHLTKDLLLFSRKQAIERKAVDLNEIIGRIEKFIVRVIGEDIKCAINLHDESMKILADRHQIEQVVMNLAANARDAMPGGGTIAIATDVISFDKYFIAAHGYGKPGRYAVLEISDTGCGMDAETRKRIFEPFFTTKEVGRGTGLGLAVVYGIVTKHDGYINVYSEPGEGTTFRIYLPMIMADEHEMEVRQQVADVTGGTETILLAEDDAVVREMTRMILMDFGYTIITANDGQDAIEQYRKHGESIRLLVFDLIMPKKSGKEAYDEIRKMTPDVRVIFASGYSPDIIRDKASLGEGTEVLYKPVTPSDLLQKVRSVLDRKLG